MKLLILVIAMMSSSVAFAIEPMLKNDSFNITSVTLGERDDVESNSQSSVFQEFDGIEKMANLSEQDNELTGAGWRTVWKWVKVGGKLAWRGIQIYSTFH